MRRTLLLSPFALLLLASPASAGRDLNAIPAGMRGSWSASLQACRLEKDDGRVIVDMRKVTIGVTRYDADHISPIGSSDSDNVRVDALVHEDGYQEGMRGSIELKLLDPGRLSITTDLISDTYVNCKDA
jgi:hypothetical protein